MEYPLLNHSSHPVSYSDLENSASHNGNHALPNDQGYPLPLGASGLDDFQTVNDVGTNDYFIPGTDSFDKTLAETEYSLGVEKEHGRSPANLDVSHVSRTTSAFQSYQYALPQTDFSFTAPLHDLQVNEQGVIWRDQLEACANVAPPNGLQTQWTAVGGMLPTDATPFNSLTPQGPSNGQHLVPDSSGYNDENAYHAAHPYQPSSTIVGLPYEAPPTILDPSYALNPVAISPKIKTEHCKLSDISHDQDLSATCCPKLNLTRHIEPEFSSTSTLSHRPHNVNKPTGFESSATTLIPRPQRRRRRLGPKKSGSEAVDPSSSTTSSRPTLPVSVAGDVNSLTTLIPCDQITYNTNLDRPEPSYISAENEVKPDDAFGELTYHYEHPGDDCQVTDNALGPFSVSHPDIAVALKFCEAMHDAGLFFQNTGREERSQLMRIDRKRTMSDTFPESEHYQTGKEQRKKSDSTSRCRYASDNHRRNDQNRYWCTNENCTSSLVYAFRNHTYEESASRKRPFSGFKNREDMRRHWKCHELHRFVCQFPHKNGKEFSCVRGDNYWS